MKLQKQDFHFIKYHLHRFLKKNNNFDEKKKLSHVAVAVLIFGLCACPLRRWWWVAILNREGSSGEVTSKILLSMKFQGLYPVIIKEQQYILESGWRMTWKTLTNHLCLTKPVKPIWAQMISSVVILRAYFGNKGSPLLFFTSPWDILKHEGRHGFKCFLHICNSIMQALKNLSLSYFCVSLVDSRPL